MSIEEQYDDMLDDLYGPVRIGTLTYDASRVLKEVDPIAYRVGLSDYESMLEEEEEEE